MYTLVFDIGKTHIKLHAVDAKGDTVCRVDTQNDVVSGSPYPHVNVEKIWQWFLQETREFAKTFSASGSRISAICVTTHGATAALINAESVQSPLVLPIMDYEFDGLASCSQAYDAQRPPFSESYSPGLPQGLNLGRQLFWLEKKYPQAFRSASHILLYPQYWAWRLSGSLCSEVTSLGSHTDLWSPQNATFSSMVVAREWEDLFPTRANAWDCIGELKPALQETMGLALPCKIFAGVHDSNASYLRYLQKENTEFAVVSTGTWCIVLAGGVALDKLQAGMDLLANVDVTGAPVACSRAMCGREYEIICQLTGASLADKPGASKLQALIDQEIYALPDFSGGSGPLARQEGRLVGEVPAGHGAAVATLYCALMLNYQLDLLAPRGSIFIEGAFVKNMTLCRVVAQLKLPQKVFLSADTTGTVYGCAQLARWHEEHSLPRTEPCSPLGLEGLDDYAQRWLALAQGALNFPVA